MAQTDGAGEPAQATTWSPPPLTPAYRAAIRVARPLFSAMTRRDWRGAQNLPREGGCVVAANHISHADPLAIAHFLVDHGRPPYFLAKASLFELPLLGRWIAACDQVPVHRGDGRAADAYRDALAAVDSGKTVVVMPESTITKDPLGWPMAGKSGAVRIALATGRPLLPLAQWGAQELLDRQGRFRPWRRPTMRLLLGPPVDLHDLRDRPLDPATLREATSRLMHRITEQLEELRGEPSPEGVWDPRLRRRVGPAPDDAARRDEVTTGDAVAPDEQAGQPADTPDAGGKDDHA